MILIKYTFILFTLTYATSYSGIKNDLKELGLHQPTGVQNNGIIPNAINGLRSRWKTRLENFINGSFKLVDPLRRYMASNENLAVVPIMAQYSPYGVIPFPVNYMDPQRHHGLPVNYIFVPQQQIGQSQFQMAQPQQIVQSQFQMAQPQQSAQSQFQIPQRQQIESPKPLQPELHQTQSVQIPQQLQLPQAQQYQIPSQIPINNYQPAFYYTQQLPPNAQFYPHLGYLGGNPQMMPIPPHMNPVVVNEVPNNMNKTNQLEVTSAQIPSNNLMMSQNIIQKTLEESYEDYDDEDEYEEEDEGYDKRKLSTDLSESYIDTNQFVDPKKLKIKYPGSYDVEDIEPISFIDPLAKTAQISVQKKLKSPRRNKPYFKEFDFLKYKPNRNF